MYKKLYNILKQHNFSNLQNIKSEIRDGLCPEENGFPLFEKLERVYCSIDDCGLYDSVSSPFMFATPLLNQPVQQIFVEPGEKFVVSNLETINILHQLRVRAVKYCIDPNGIFILNKYKEIKTKNYMQYLLPTLIQSQLVAAKHNTTLTTKAVLDGLYLCKIQKNSSFKIFDALNNSIALQIMLRNLEKILNLTKLNEQQLKSIANALVDFDNIDEKHLKYTVNIATFIALEQWEKTYREIPIWGNLLWYSDLFTGIKVFNKLQIIKNNVLLPEIINLRFEQQMNLCKQSKVFFGKNVLSLPIKFLCIHVANAKILLKCTQLAVAVERYRVKNKRLPKTLDLLVPEFLSSIPRNPFNGNMLQYKRGIFELKGYKFPADIKLIKKSNLHLFSYGVKKDIFPQPILLKIRGYCIQGIGKSTFSNKQHIITVYIVNQNVFAGSEGRLRRRLKPMF